MIQLVDVTMSAGTRELLSGASLHIHPGDRVGLVGRNGTGKTTLLRLFLGDNRPDAGSCTVRPGVEVGYLPQQAVSGSTQPLWDEARSGMRALNALHARYQAAERAVAAGEEGSVERFDAVSEAFRLEGGYAMDERVGGVLHGLGFSKEDWGKTCDTFSGGWQMRIALARLLLSDAQLLFLDEPTNHLDIVARTWLARELTRVGRTVVVVSHDRYLLDRVTTRTVEVAGGRLHAFSGGFSDWLKERALRFEQAQAAYASQKAEIERLERFVDRFRAKATKAAQAKSRQRQLDKMERLDAPETEGVPRYTLPEPPPSSHELLTLLQASAGYGGAPVFQGVELHLAREMRVAVLGPNGCGKSTLLKALSGELSLLRGRRRVGEGARVGVFSQDLAQALPGDLTGLEYLGTVAPEVTLTTAWSRLGALGLGGERAQQPIRSLSGGEKARVALAALAVRPHNALLLDEPTNHLDAVTAEVLVEALKSWGGAVMMVSHDRHLVEQVATHVLRFGPDGAELIEGVRPEHFEIAALVRGEGEERSGGGESWDDRKRLARAREKARRQADKVLARIERLEAKVAALDAELFERGADFEVAARLGKEQAALHQEIEARFAEWEALEAEAE
ncbi:MAG: ABC-F family ATP-binding cassette domain-containing protein [Deltaproteobacteria bacterium]|nr:ABC-F family ATP-binding cassette domain-containing protein [Deltaproteobacteria bacterium]